ncbi:MAG: amidohydrolase [Acidobacteria bacterium]|nr:amidohydrolase [Acidobacteriota bacterium]MBV9144698.1 amidohydrolase [Acidobacteriota bacterium]MBV9436755.1 amidohydrolase [Acidobacteriota bacterium]
MALASYAQTHPAAETIITNANVWTVDRNHPQAEAVAILGQRIVAVGTSTELDGWRGPQTKIIDAGGKLLLPGFNDAHVHFVQSGFQLDQVQLTDARTREQFVSRVAAQAKKLKKGEWMLGGEWDEQNWTPADLPTHDWIDAATVDNPVFIERHDGHEALANALAMKLAGVTASTKAPPGGEIVHDAQGNPTGVFKDAAQGLIEKAIPEPGLEARIKASKRALEYAASLGVTSVQAMVPDYQDIEAFSVLADRGELTSRIYTAPIETHWRDQAHIGIRHAFGSDFLRMGAVKGFADGSLGSTTAYFFEPYVDAPNTRGLLSSEMQPISGMRDRLTGADKAGLQLCIHAIGDQAISIVLDIFQDIENANGSSDRRWRIEHAQHVAPKDLQRFAALHVIASVQPYHAIDDGQWAERRIGPIRAKTTYPFRTFLDDGVKLAFGTDWPVAPVNPMLGLYAAVTRATLDGKHPGGWVPEQKINIQEAIEAYTLGSAFAEFQDKEKGSITPGKLADLILVSDNLLKIDPRAVRDAKVEMTMVGGKIVYGGPPQ